MEGTGGAYREVWRVRDARSLISASASSQLGDWLYNAALLGYVYSATGSAVWVGAATIVRLVPFVLLGPLGGSIADRFDRRRVLLVGDLLRLAIMLLLALVVAIDGPVVVVLALTGLASAAGSAEKPAAMALMPRLVGERHLGPANALLHTVQDLGVVVGPALGALLLAVASPEWSFVANGLTFALSAILISTMRPAPVKDRSSGQTGIIGHLVGGFGVTRRTPFALPMLLIVAMVEFTYGAQTVQLVLYAQRDLDMGSAGYGWLLAASGVGGLTSVLVNHRLSVSLRVTAAVTVTAALAVVGQLVFAGTDLIVVALLVAGLGGVGLVACEVVAETAIARVTPPAAFGRVMGVFDALTVAAMILGAVLAAVLVPTVGLGWSFVLLGLVALVGIVACLPALRGLDATNRVRADALAERMAAIENLPMVTGSPQVVLEILASRAEWCRLPAGVDVVVEGDPAHAFYVLTEGDAIAHKGDEILRHIHAVDFFGERGLLDNLPRSATVTTSSDATLLRIDGDAFLDAVQSSPTMLAAVDIRHPDLVRDGRFGPTSGAEAEIGPDSSHDMRAARGVEGAVVVVVSAGYEGKRRSIERLRDLGARVVVVDEPGHWSQRLVTDGVAESWVAAPVTGDPDTDAAAVVDALTAAGIAPEAVLTFWEDSTCTAVRVAAALGLPGNPPEAVDAARSKIRMREHSATLGLPTPRAQRVRSLDELFAAAEHVGFPAVVKPEFGASAVGCVRVDTKEQLPDVYGLVRSVVNPGTDAIFRMGNDLLIEEYLDGVEFDVDLVMHAGECVFSSVSQNWPTNEPSFQETGLHCPADHDKRAVRKLVDLAVLHAQRFGLHDGVLHIEGKCTSRGPRIVEINCRIGGGRIAEIVERVWGVDLVAAQLRASLGLAPSLDPARKPLCGVANVIVQAHRSGHLVTDAVPLARPADATWWEVDHPLVAGEPVQGPEAVFATVLADVNIAATDLRTARAIADRVLANRPTID